LFRSKDVHGNSIKSYGGRLWKKRSSDSKGKGEKVKWDWDTAIKNAVTCGVSIAEFWELTPAELNIIIECYSDKIKNDLKTNITVAYYNAYFQRVKKMPKLDAFIEKLFPPEKQEMDNEAMFQQVLKLHKALGGT
jgi:hypothetical protein